MATIDQQFVEYIVKTLVNNPDKVEVERRIDEKGVLLSLSVDPEDVGRVIGRRGVTAQSIRTLLRALGTKNEAHYNLKIVNMDQDDSEATDVKKEGSAEPSSAKNQAKEADSADDSSEEREDEVDAETSELAEKTRAELADLDDLEI